MELVTGATGLVGSHVAESLVAAGRDVRALVRPASEVAHLRALGVELAWGDLCEPAGLEGAMREVRVVYHCAARVSDWGRPAEFLEVGVRGTERVASLALRLGVERFVQLSSVAAYGLLRMQGRRVRETWRLSRVPAWWDPYARAKAGAERVLWKLAARKGLPLVVLRPTFVYGLRDRLVLPRMARLLRERRLRPIGSGRNRPHFIHAQDVARAALAAAGCALASGRAYNLDGPRDATQREMLDALADLEGVPRPQGRLPLAPTWLRAVAGEASARLVRRASPPLITRYVVAALAGEADIDTSRARRELGWEPRVGTLDGFAAAHTSRHGRALSGGGAAT